VTDQGQRRITVAGEALIDLIMDPDGRLDPRPGGGPFNVARAVARLGQPAAFLGRLSQDRFGRMMREDLDCHGVLVPLESADAPTTLAVVDVDAAGVPGYRFYLTGTAAAAIEPGQASLPPDTTALHVGTLGLVMEPIATSLDQLVTSLPGDITLMLDPNSRPSVIASRRAYLDRLDGIVRRADLVKMSTEDLAYLYPGDAAAHAAADLLGRGPACVVITDGAAPVRAFTRGHEGGGQEIRVEVPPAEVADTVGAGDAFGGAFLTWWVGNGLGRADLGEPSAVRSAMQAAVWASVVTCTRRGAEPPWAYELAGHEGWRWLTPNPAAGCRG
jgi:fructokinase